MNPDEFLEYREKMFNNQIAPSPIDTEDNERNQKKEKKNKKPKSYLTKFGKKNQLNLSDNLSQSFQNIKQFPWHKLIGFGLLLIALSVVVLIIVLNFSYDIEEFVFIGLRFNPNP